MNDLKTVIIKRQSIKSLKGKLKRKYDFVGEGENYG